MEDNIERREIVKTATYEGLLRKWLLGLTEVWKAET